MGHDQRTWGSNQPGILKSPHYFEKALKKRYRTTKVLTKFHYYFLDILYLLRYKGALREGI